MACPLGVALQCAALPSLALAGAHDGHRMCTLYPSRRQALCTEPLERRWLLSATPALPPALANSIQQAYPGASVLTVEVSTDDGQQEFDVTAAVAGGTLDATLSSDGK